MASILLITPDRSFAEYASQVLSAAGHHVVSAATADDAVRSAISVPIDVVVADTLTEGLDDLREQLDRIRTVPFVFVAPSSLPIREGDRFIRKPASRDDLCDAVSAVLAPPGFGPQVDFGSGLTFDRTGQRMVRENMSELLTPIEFSLLDYLTNTRGFIARTEDLLEDVWHYTKGTASSDVVRSHMKNLRAKIRRVNAGQDIIETIPRRGYRLS